MGGRPKLEVLDALRGFCALIVVLLHFTENYGFRHCSAIVPHGHLPVEYFFILTGFTFVYAYDARWREMSVWSFFRRRLVRMHPLVIVGSFVGLLACLVAPELYTPDFPRALGLGETLLLFLWCCTLLPCPKALGWTLLHPLQGPLWTMFYIYVANVLYALVLRHLRTWMLVLLAIAAAGATYWFGCTYKGFTYGPQWSERQITGGFVRLAFPVLAGMVIARRGWRLRLGDGALWTCIAVLAAVFFAPMALPKTIWNGLFEASAAVVVMPFVLLVGAGGTISNPRLAAVCRFLGAYSFPLYATHYPLTLLDRLWMAAHPDAPLALHLAVAAVFAGLALVVGWVAMRAVDSLGRRRRSGSGRAMRTTRVCGVEADVAETAFERLRGLIGHARLPPGRGLLILKCNCIHTFFMSFPIDACFLDRDDKVVKVVRNIPPWRPFVWGGWRATKVLETAASAGCRRG